MTFKTFIAGKGIMKGTPTQIIRDLNTGLQESVICSATIAVDCVAIYTFVSPVRGPGERLSV